MYQFIEDEKLGVLCRTEDSADIAEKLTFLMANSDEVRAMVERARREVVASYSWESQADNLVALYKRLDV